MDIETITPDHIVFWRSGWININLTLISTWIVMAVLTIASWWATRKIGCGTDPSRWQLFLEIIVEGICKQIRDISRSDASDYVAFTGTLFLFIATSNLMSVIPGFTAPTSSLSTTAALAGCVFFAVPVFAIRKIGVWAYLKGYFEPTPLMLPFNIIGDFSRTLALAVRLFGNMMSGAKIGAILLIVIPLVFPVLMDLLGLITGLVQAYIFAILAQVYIASAMRVHQTRYEKQKLQHN